MIAGNAPSRHRTMADDRKAVRFSGHHVNVAKQSSGHYKILAGATVHKSVNMAPWAPLKCKAWPINAQHTHTRPLSYLESTAFRVSYRQCNAQAVCLLRGAAKYLRLFTLISYFSPQAVSCRPSHRRSPDSIPG